jgi:hypothetical protein
MAQAPKADPPRCDVPGCSHLADFMTDGTEKDTAVGPKGPLNRPSIKNINLCTTHSNWSCSEDGARFAATDVYRARK